MNDLTGKKLIGLDIGTKRIGIAICDETHTIASPRLIINRQSNEKDFNKISEIIEENKIGGIVIGLPLNMDGSESEMSQFIRKFAENFEEFLEKNHPKKNLPIELYDERLSSSEARDFQSSELSRKRNKFYDDIAASVILQSFIDND